MVSIRPFRTSDQGAARALIEEGLGEHFGFVDPNANPDLVDIAASYALSPNAFFVAEFDSVVVGTTGVIVQATIGRLVRVAVARRYRRHGIATALMDGVVGFATQTGLTELVAHTQPEWPDALGFYNSHGFTPYGRDGVDVYLRRSVVLASESDVVPVARGQAAP
jgi:GNAT superfamily N-acetyltransferase